MQSRNRKLNFIRIGEIIMSEKEQDNINKEEEVKDTNKVEEKAVESEDEIEDIDLDSLTDETQDIRTEYLEQNSRNSI